MVLSLQGFSQRQVVLNYAVGSYSGCTGGAWVASNGWNFGGIYRWFMNWYGNLETVVNVMSIKAHVKERKVLDWLNDWYHILS